MCYKSLVLFICDDISIVEEIHNQFIRFLAGLLSTDNFCLQTVTTLAFRTSNSTVYGSFEQFMVHLKSR